MDAWDAELKSELASVLPSSKGERSLTSDEQQQVRKDATALRIRIQELVAEYSHMELHIARDQEEIFKRMTSAFRAAQEVAAVVMGK